MIPCLMLFLLAVSVLGEEWGTVNEIRPFGRRTGHSIVKLSDDRVVMFGGEDANADLFNDLHVFNSEKWSLVTTEDGVLPPERKDHEAWVADDIMYIFGGSGHENGEDPEEETLFNDLWGYDPDLNKWEEIPLTDPKPVPRKNCAVAVSDDGETVVLTGGQAPEGTPGTLFPNYDLDETWAYNLKENTFEEKEKIPHPLYDHRMFRYKGYYYVLKVFPGGTKMFKLNEADLKWEILELEGEVPDFALTETAVKLPNTGMFKSAKASEAAAGAFVIGGLAYHGTAGFEPIADVWFFDFGTETWTKKEDLPFALMDAASYYDAQNHQIKVYGGIKGDSTYNDDVLVYQLPETFVDETAEQPETFGLCQNFPNPFNPVTTITYTVSDNGWVSLRISDIQGRTLKTLVSQNQKPGIYQKAFDGTDLPSGIYFCRLDTDPGSKTIKLMLIK